MSMDASMFYRPVTAEFLDLVKCSDGKYRTPWQKEQFDAGKIKPQWCALRQIWVDV